MFFHDPIYEARVILTPSIINDLSTLNYNRSPNTLLKRVIPSDVYLLFKNILIADSTVKKFVKQKGDKNFLYVSNGLTRYESLIIAKSSQKKEALERVNQYIDFTNKIALDLLLNILTKELEQAKINIKKEIYILEKSLQIEKQLLRLNDALKIVQAKESKNVNPTLNVEINNLKKPGMTNFHSQQLITLNKTYEKLEHTNFLHMNPILARTSGDITVSENLLYVNWIRNVIIFSILGGLITCLGLTLVFIRSNRGVELI